MTVAPLQRIIPLERYRDIIAAFDFDHQTWRDAYWMRFAAQAGFLCPDEPVTLAKRITLIANELLKQAKWFDAFRSPMRFVIAAVLVQTNTKVVDFLHDYKRLEEILDQVGLKHGGLYEPITLLILRMNSEHHVFTLLEAERLKNIYQHMKSFHWWITGIDDLPACAALLQIPGSAEVITAEAEVIYQRLLSLGLQGGSDLQNAVHILLLSEVRANDSVNRFMSLLSQAETKNITILPAHYDGLSVLSLLEQPASVIVDRLQAAQSELDLCRPDLKGPSSFALAADLTALDLVRYNASGQGLKSLKQGEHMLKRLHALNIAKLVQVSHIDMKLDFDAIGYISPSWPQG
jgi:Protein of unknown function (DUF4003)